MIPNFVQGNDFRLTVNITSLHVEEGEQVATNFDITNCTDIHVYLTKLNNAAHCENKYEISYTLDDEHNNMIILDINEVYPVGSYGLEIIGISEIGEHWRFKAKQGELFNIVDATSSANYTDNGSLITDRYINLDAEIGVLGKGDKGDTGETGPKGDKGPKGDTGDRGPQWYTGTAITHTGTHSIVSGSKVGDYYLNTDTGDVFECLAATDTRQIWNFKYNIKGPTGDKGDTGETGI